MVARNARSKKQALSAEAHFFLQKYCVEWPWRRIVSKRRSAFLPSEVSIWSERNAKVSKRRSAFLPSEGQKNILTPSLKFLSAEAHFFLQKFQIKGKQDGLFLSAEANFFLQKQQLSQKEAVSF